eukprot:7355659-Prymnesium_polylepis.1
MKGVLGFARDRCESAVLGCSHTSWTVLTFVKGQALTREFRAGWGRHRVWRAGWGEEEAVRRPLLTTGDAASAASVAQVETLGLSEAVLQLSASDDGHRTVWRFGPAACAAARRCCSTAAGCARTSRPLSSARWTVLTASSCTSTRRGLDR